MNEYVVAVLQDGVNSLLVKPSLFKNCHVFNNRIKKEMCLRYGATLLILLIVTSTLLPSSAAGNGDFSEVKTDISTIDDLSRLYQPYSSKITPYQPIYFLVGTDPEKSKFQISFKFRPVEKESSLAKEHPWVNGFHLAYTQRSFWNLAGSSKPFEDTSYMPEFFWASRQLNDSVGNGANFFSFLQMGIQHESNGRPEPQSRSTNRIYIRPSFIAYDNVSRLGIMLAPKLWAYVANDDETNPDLYKYRGFFDMEVKLGHADSFVMEAHLRPAEKGTSFQADISYPLSRYITKTFGVYLHIQYTNALAESLIDYEKRTEAIRVGLSIVR